MAAAPFDWSEFLQLANTLAAHPDEASQRTSISRAYYCVYHKACERAIFTGYVDQQNHWAVWNFYKKNSNDRICRKLGELGSRMHKERKDADYNPLATRLNHRMAAQLKNASIFLSQLAQVGAGGLPQP